LAIVGTIFDAVTVYIKLLLAFFRSYVVDLGSIVVWIATPILLYLFLVLTRTIIIMKQTDKEGNNKSHQMNNNSQADNPYKILGCNPSDSDDIIKKNYRILVRKFHPDFVQGKELDDEFIDFATKKIQEINNAYETIKKERNL